MKINHTYNDLQEKNQTERDICSDVPILKIVFFSKCRSQRRLGKAFQNENSQQETKENKGL